MATAEDFIFPLSCLQIFGTCWCGTTKIKISASLQEVKRSGIATYKKFKFTWKFIQNIIQKVKNYTN